MAQLSAVSNQALLKNLTFFIPGLLYVIYFNLSMFLAWYVFFLVRVPKLQ